MRTPSQEYLNSPSAIREGITRRAMLTGTAMPTPEETPVLLMMLVLMPMTRPWRSSRGPPELPGLTAASV